MGRHTFSTSFAKVGLMPTKDSVVLLNCECVGVSVGVCNTGKTRSDEWEDVVNL